MPKRISHHELDIPYPFSLITNDTATNRLVVFPAFWFSNDMYALMRSRIKFSKRDQRIHRGQHIEHDPFAPDTIEEIFSAISLLERATGQAWYDEEGLSASSDSEIELKGRSLLEQNSGLSEDIILSKHQIEKSKRIVVIKKAAQAWNMYREMILWYAVKNIVQYPGAGSHQFSKLIPSKRDTKVDKLRRADLA